MLILKSPKSGKPSPLSGVKISLMNGLLWDSFENFLNMHACAYMLSYMTTKRNKAINNLIKAFDSYFFKTLSEPIRIEILKFLLKNGRSDIMTVAKHIKKDRSVLSRHLHMMTEVGILRSEKVVRNTFFEVDAKSLKETVGMIFRQVNQALESCCPQD